MANRDPAGQFNINKITEVIKVFGDVPVSLTTLIDLGTTYIYTHLLVVNSLNNDVTIKFGDNEITLPSSKDLAVDCFRFNDVIEYKYKTLAPTSGSMQIIFY